jgi:hypothetical protein
MSRLRVFSSTPRFQRRLWRAGIHGTRARMEAHTKTHTYSQIYYTYAVATRKRSCLPFGRAGSFRPCILSLRLHKRLYRDGDDAILFSRYCFLCTRRFLNPGSDLCSPVGDENVLYIYIYTRKSK